MLVPHVRTVAAALRAYGSAQAGVLRDPANPLRYRRLDDAAYTLCVLMGQHNAADAVRTSRTPSHPGHGRWSSTPGSAEVPGYPLTWSGPCRRLGPRRLAGIRSCPAVLRMPQYGGVSAGGRRRTYGDRRDRVH